MPRQPTKPTNLLISTPFQKINSAATDCLPGSSRAGEGARRTGAVQPLMVVVLVESAHAPTAALATTAGWKTGRDANIVEHCNPPWLMHG